MCPLKAQKKWPDMPYPGLRPFEITEEIDESLIFFGRQNQVFELIDRLAESHLVAVIGPSGCGKSSLVLVGLIPSLEYGYLYKAGARWVTTIMEPGSHPIQALSEALSYAVAKSDASNGPKQRSGTTSDFKARLQKQPDALVEFSDEIPLIFGERTNLLILIDQFEELFREDLTSPQEALDLINLILNVFNARPDRLYIVITMRTDCLEQCAYYRGLPEALNQTHYLPPRLNDEELREAIIKPIELEQFGGSVEPALLRQLLYEMSDEVSYDPDYLPLMQHALAWMWQPFKHGVSGEKTKPILKLIDYETFDGLAGSLSEHANKILNNLSAAQQKIAEVMFRLLSDFGSGGRITRRVTAPERIAAVAGVSTEEVAPVIDAFTDKDSCFVRWKDKRTRLDVAHESLIRKWNKLEKWVKEEARSAEIYRKIERTARNWKEKKISLLTGPELENVLEWEKNEKPTAQWAERYGDDFGLVKQFLEQSKKKKSRRRLRKYIAIVLAILLIIAGSMWSLWIAYKEFTGEGQMLQIKTDYKRIILKEKKIKDENLKQGAEVFAQWREPAIANSILKRIDDQDIREEAVEKVSKIFALNGQLQTARKVVDIISDPARVLEKVGAALVLEGKVQDAKWVADNIADPMRKASVLRDVAVAILEQEFKVEDALRVADNIAVQKGKDMVLQGVAVALVRVLKFEEAQRVVNKIIGLTKRANVLLFIVNGLVQEGKIEGAQRVAGEITVQTDRDEALRNVAEALAIAGNFDKAQDVVKGISNSEVKNRALGKVVVTLVQTGRDGDAQRIANKITNQNGKTMVLKDMAIALFRAGRVKKALHVANNIIDPERKPKLLKDMAEVLIREGRVQDAQQVADIIPNQVDKVGVLNSVAVALAQEGKADEAKQVIDGIPNVDDREPALQAVAVALAHAGKIQVALRVAKGFPTSENKYRALETMVITLIDDGEVEDAKRLAERIEGILNIESKSFVLGKISTALAKAGEVDEALRVADGIPEPETKYWTLRTVAVALVKLGKVDEARRVTKNTYSPEGNTTILEGVVEALIEDNKVEEANWVAEVIPKKSDKDENLRQVAWAFAKVGAFEKALRVAKGISNSNEKTWAIGDVAVALVNKDRGEEAYKVVIDANIENSNKDISLTRVAEEFAKAGKLRQATNIVEYISDSASKLDTYSRIFNLFYKPSHNAVERIQKNSPAEPL